MECSIDFDCFSKEQLYKMLSIKKGDLKKDTKQTNYDEFNIKITETSPIKRFKHLCPSFTFTYLLLLLLQNCQHFIFKKRTILNYSFFS